MTIHINKQTKISYQESKHESYTPQTFSNINDAKNFYYTANELAEFEKWCSQVQWAVVNDDDGNATQLKVTVHFNAEPAGNADNWHSALDALQTETASHLEKDNNTFPNKKGAVEIKIKESDDHLF